MAGGMHVIVTGGSSGIGFEIARLFALRGSRISLIARRHDQLRQAQSELKRLTSQPVFIVCADVTVAANIDKAIVACEQHNGPCDLLVTSAGMVKPSMFDDCDAASFDTHIDTNFTGTTNAIRSVYPGMLVRGHGVIMMVSSAAAMLGIPGYAGYCASKAALRAFAEALRAEAGGRGVDVCICFPPDTRTPQFDQEIKERPMIAHSLMGRVAPWEAVEVAQRIVKAIDRRKAEAHFGFKLTALAWLAPWIKPLLFWQLRHKSSQLQRTERVAGPES